MGSFFDGVDSGLRVKLTELWIKNSKPPPGPRRRTRVSIWMIFDVVRIREDA